MNKVEKSNKIRLGIVGSRDFHDYNRFEEKLLDLLKEWEDPDIDYVVSGGASGIDTLADEWCTENYIKIKVFEADWDLGRKAGPIRNSKIVEEITHLIAFPSHKGRGTQDTIKKAEKKGIPIKIHFVD